MKIGDKVCLKGSVRTATIIRSEITNFLDDDGKQRTKSRYFAKSESGETWIFYGYEVGKKLFKFKQPSPQLSLFDEES